MSTTKKQLKKQAAAAATTASVEPAQTAGPAESDAPAEIVPTTGLWSSVVQSVLTPGVTPFLERAIHAVFAALIMVVAVTAWNAREGRVHLVALLVLAASLYGCIVWFIHEQRAIRAEEAAAAASAGRRAARAEPQPQGSKKQKKTQ